MPNDKRLADGFSTLDGGHNDGISPSLIENNQCAFANNFTFRGGFAKTRQPWANLNLTFDTPETEANFTGIFQGAVEYQNPDGVTQQIVSVGGHLFLMDLGPPVVISEITPQLQIYTAQALNDPIQPNYSFTVPAEGSQVSVPVNNADAFAGQTTVYIDGGQYTVVSIEDVSSIEGIVILQYVSGAYRPIVGPNVPVYISTGVFLYQVQSNPANFDFVNLFQAENYVVTLAAKNPPVIFDGANTTLASPAMIPPGMFGIYLWGRIWIVLPNRKNFVAGDLVGSSSGSPGLSYVDAILQMTENSYLNGGGAFTAPSNRGFINGLTELAQVDTSLGTGNLMCGQTRGLFSVNTPVDRTTWQNLTYPIQTISTLDFGPIGPRSISQMNNDIWFRSLDGLRSYKNARREFGQEGNTPQSQEVRELLSTDDQNMLFYVSSMLFENRMYFTIAPQRTTSGVVFLGLVVNNFDLVSNQRTKLPAAYEGVSTGLQIFQILTMDFANGKQRGFAWVLGDDGEIELWEVGVYGYYDTYNSGTNIVRVSIQSALETKSFHAGDGDLLKELITAALYLDELVDNVTLVIKYRPDQYPLWTTWCTVNLCADVTQCSILAPLNNGQCRVYQRPNSLYAARILLPTPLNTFNALSEFPMNWGYEFQMRFECIGKFRIRKLKTFFNIRSDNCVGVLPTTVECATVSGCQLPVYGYDSHG